jgi:hypothetical protein
MLKKITFLLLFFYARVLCAQHPTNEHWEPLFNGKDLQNWTPKITGYPAGDNFGNTFRVENGLLVVRYDAYDAFENRFGHLFFNKPYSYYRLRIEYRFTGQQVLGGPSWAFRNSGVMIHGQTPESMGLHQDFPVSIEVQFLGSTPEEQRPTCNLCTPGTHVKMEGKLFTPHCVNSKSVPLQGDQWVTAEVVVLGDSLIQHFVNGAEVIRYEAPQLGGGNVNGQQLSWGKEGELIKSGTLSLQSESHPVEFRKVELLNLEGCMDPSAKNYRSYYVHSKLTDCIYSVKE